MFGWRRTLVTALTLNGVALVPGKTTFPSHAAPHIALRYINPSKPS
jgi:hypothetical protein